MNTVKFPRLRPLCGLAAIALALGLISCSNAAQSNAHRVNIQIGGSAAARPVGIFGDSAVTSVTVAITDSDNNPVGSISLTKYADHWGGSIELTGSGLYTFSATAASSGGGTMYTGSTSRNIPNDGLTVMMLLSSHTYAIGDTGPAGGLVFYDNGSYTGTPAWRYLEAATSDQSAGIVWWNGSYITISTDTAIGTGKSNTTAIVAAQGSGSYAASLCKNLSLGGYSDWFLPSKDELHAMYTYQTAAGLSGISGSVFYWSSSMINSDQAWGLVFSSDYQGGVYTDSSRWVRAVRAF